jgi:hypothetical protein
MAAAPKAIEFMSGILYWAKILGAPRLNYNGDGTEWTVEFMPDANGIAVLKKHKLLDRLKVKDDRTNVLVLRKKGKNADGTDADPIRILDKEDAAWPANTLIGNGSKADVKVSIRDYGPGKKKGIYVEAIRITEHVPYVSSEFAAMDQKKEPKAKKDVFSEDFELEN